MKDFRYWMCTSILDFVGHVILPLCVLQAGNECTTGDNSLNNIDKNTVYDNSKHRGNRVNIHNCFE